MKKADIFTIGLAIGFMVPILGVAGIILHNDIGSGNPSSVPGMVYLQPGPGYNASNQAGLITLAENNLRSTNLSVEFSHPSGLGIVNLVNVVSIVNHAATGNYTGIWFNGTLPPGVTLLMSSSKMTSSGASITGSNVQIFNNTFNLSLDSSSQGQLYYISFQVNSSINNPANLIVSESAK